MRLQSLKPGRMPPNSLWHPRYSTTIPDLILLTSCIGGAIFTYLISQMMKLRHKKISQARKKIRVGLDWAEYIMVHVLGTHVRPTHTLPQHTDIPTQPVPSLKGGTGPSGPSPLGLTYPGGTVGPGQLTAVGALENVIISALAGVVQWTECQLTNQRVTSLIPRLGHMLGLQARCPVGGG